MKPIVYSLLFLIVMILPGWSAPSFGSGQKVAGMTGDSLRFISTGISKGSLMIAGDGQVLPLVVSEDEYPGVIRVAGYVQEDLKKVTGSKPELIIGNLPASGGIILAGTLGKSALIDELVQRRKFDVSDLRGKWETFLIEIIDRPFPGIDHALVIAGSDKRGTIFGMFDLSRKIGVSPWYWWADVPVPEQEVLYAKAGRYLSGEPKIKYRGIFLNDEEPALGRWAVKTYGGFTHEFYEKVFELILRLKGNYLWPAMWWASFNSDDTLNPVLADELGIVMGTTHHEPMMRAHAEWKPYGGKDWNYETNAQQLRQFWKEGIERMGNRESIVTLGMRGDGDMAMTKETNIALLERIVAGQREIIEEVTGKPVEETPQLWALYKEVQDYYDQGMQVPDDVTLLLSDDNWGNIRRLPVPDAAPRAGGYGIYYHFDYVGGPRNYKWLNTSPLPRVWEQMHMAYEHGVDRIWLVNVGDLKPMELPISFFLDYAWDPDAWPAERLPEYTINWAAEQFGEARAPEIAEMLSLYTKYNGRRKPELLSPETYSLIHFREAERVVDDYNRLARQAEELGKKLPGKYADAWYELVLHPITACANLNELYFAVAKNHEAVSQGRGTANDWAQKARVLFQKDTEITNNYHTRLAGGKWDHMMSQTHIGYTYWQQPEQNVMPEVNAINLPEKSEMGIAIQGADTFWTAGEATVCLPEILTIAGDSVYIDVFNRGSQPFHFESGTGESWLRVKPASGTIEKEQRIWMTVDPDNVPAGKHQVPVVIRQDGGSEVTVQAQVCHPGVPDLQAFHGFIESNGFVSMEAEHFTRNIPANGICWKVIPGLGRTLSAVTVFPVTTPPAMPGENSPRLEYDLYLCQAGEVRVSLYLSPTLNYPGDEGLELAVSFDDQEPVVINMHQDDSSEAWNKWVSNNINKVVSRHRIEAPGKHTLKIHMVDPGVVLQKLVVQTGEEKPAYLGEPESFSLN